MIAREDFVLFMQAKVAEIEKDRDRFYRSLDILPVKDFEGRDAINHEIASLIGEQRAYRKIWDWISENYPKEDQAPKDQKTKSTEKISDGSREALMGLQNRISQAQLKDKYDGYSNG